MLTTYVRRKFRQYTLVLLILQSVIIFVLLFYFFGLLKKASPSLQADISQLLIDTQNEYNGLLDAGTYSIRKEIAEEWYLGEGKRNALLTAGIRVDEITTQTMNKINDVIKSHERRENLSYLVEEHKKQSLKVLNDYYVDSIENTNQYEFDIGHFNAIYGLSRKGRDSILWNRFNYLKTTDSYVAYCISIKTVLRRIEKNLALLFLGKTTNHNSHLKFQVEVNAPNQVQVGDSLKAQIYCVNIQPFLGEIIIEDSILATGKIVKEEFIILAKETGIQHFEGAFRTKGPYGETKTYPFEHTYTVLPKCK